MYDTKPHLVTGITPSGNLTIAHYLFIIKPLLKIKKNYNLFLFIADLHAITTKHSPDQLIQLRKETTYFLFACGFDHDEIFVQSQIAGLSKMAFILGCHVNIGKLSIMTQFKSKSIHNEQTLALLNYPLLMASDILLYDADVLVSNDQKQHLELTRDLAEKMNNKFKKEIFHLPNLIDNNFFSYRLRNLKEPNKKMSKSESDAKGVIFLNDDLSLIEKKIISCKTDSENKIYFDFVKKPGVSNLILMYALAKEIKIMEAVTILKAKCENYFILKQEVAKSIIEIIKPLQAKVNNLKKTPLLIEGYLKKGKNKAQQQVDFKFSQIQKYLGFKF